MRALALAAVLLAAIPAHDQDQQMKPPSPDEMQAMMAMMGPGPEHKDFEPLAGTWDMDITFNMGGPPMKVSGRAVNTLILGGRFLKSETKGHAPVMGVDVESLSIYGFDRRTNEYTVVGYDTMGTYYVTAAGKKQPGAKEVVMQGWIEEDAPVSGRMDYDMVLRWVDADTYVSEIIFKFPAGPTKVAEMTFRRAK